MKINFKTGILLALLVVPVLVWLFLDIFGQNRYDVPVFYEQGIPPTEACAQDSQTHQVTLPPLLQPDQQTFTEAQLTDRLTVVHFFSYPCDSACSDLMEVFARIQQVFEDDDKVQLLMIEDSAQPISALSALAATYRAAPDKWYYLGGEKPAIETLKRCQFVLQVQEDLRQPIILLDTQRRIRGYYDGTDPEEVDRLILETRILLYNLMQDNA